MPTAPLSEISALKDEGTQSRSLRSEKAGEGQKLTSDASILGKFCHHEEKKVSSF